MKASMLILLACAGTASADVVIDRSDMRILQNGVDVIITATELGSAGTVSNAGLPTDFYSDMDAGSGFQAVPAATGGAIGSDDYTSIASNDIALSNFGFVGGVDTDNGVMFFDFFDAGGAFVDGFGIVLGAGNFIYDITIGTEVIAANAGFVQATVTGDVLDAFGGLTAAGVAGQWFVSDAAATVGDNGADAAGLEGSGLNQRFSITGAEVPAPGSVALLGLGGMLAARRRR